MPWMMPPLIIATSHRPISPFGRMGVSILIKQTPPEMTPNLENCSASSLIIFAVWGLILGILYAVLHR